MNAARDRLILYYHHVSDDAADYTYVSPREFAQQLEWLRSTRVAATLGDTTAADGSFCVTFDDGYDDVRRALPVLDRLGVRATLFVLPAYVGRTSTFNRLGAPSLHLSASDIRFLASEGHEIASHGLDHVDLRGLSDEELVHELVVSRTLLEDILQKEVRHFAYPYGLCDARVVRTCLNVYDDAWTTLPSKSPSGADQHGARTRTYLRKETDGAFIVAR